MRIRDVRAQQYRIGQIPDPVGAEVMLAQPHDLEAQFLGQHGLLSEIIEHLGGVGGLSRRRRHGRECREPHGETSCTAGLHQIILHTCAGPERWLSRETEGPQGGLEMRVAPLGLPSLRIH